MRAIALIPARSGSKGIPGKNLRLLGGKPLIEWTIDTALQVGGLDRLVVSAGDDVIAHYALRAGAEAFVRAENLNGDSTPMIDVVFDAIEYLSLDDDDIIVLLQPTSPFRSIESVRRCARWLRQGPESDSAMTVLRVPDRYHPDQIVRDFEQSFPVNRQELEPTYVRAGTVYAFYAGTVGTHGNIYGRNGHNLEVPESEALNLDEMADWHEAERRVRHDEENRAAEAARASSVQRKEQAQPGTL